MQFVRPMRMRRALFISVMLVAACCAPDIVWAQETQETQEPARPLRFLQETPWTVSAPGALSSSMPVLAWWDSEAGRYYLDITDFFDRLGFDVAAQDSVVEARGAGRIFTVDFSTGRVSQDLSEPVDLVSETFLRVKGATTSHWKGAEDVHHGRHAVRLCDAAHQAFDGCRSVGGEPSGGLRRPRSRSLALRSFTPHSGNTHVNYRLTRSDRQTGSPNYNGGFQVHANALGGRLAAEGSLAMTQGHTTTRFRSLNYLLDFPDSPLLKRVEIGRMSMYEWPLRTTYDGVRLSNMPLSTRYVQREAVVRGIAEPDAIIAASVGGVLADRVRADAQGRYALRIPAYYGSSQGPARDRSSRGGVPTTVTRYLFIGEDLLPPGAFWYDARAGRDGFDDTLFGFGQARYGLIRASPRRPPSYT